MKALTFNFEEALLSAEGLAILAGADLIPARNKNLKGAPSDARSVIAHTTEKITIDVDDRTDANTNNYMGKMGGKDNIWFSKKPYLGHNGDIYLMLLDAAGEISGAPIQINKDVAADTDGKKLYINKFAAGDYCKAYDVNGKQITVTAPATAEAFATFDDGVAYYVGTEGGETPAAGVYEITANGVFKSLIGQPKAYEENGKFVYKANCPSVMKGDIVLIDYYVEYRHNATQVSILPDKFAPFMYVEGSSLIRRASDGKDLPVEFVIPKLKIATAINFTLQSTGDASTFAFNGDAYPDYSKFDLTRKVLADIQILDADDNYDGMGGEDAGDPTDYRRYQYNEDTEGEYLWKDPAIAAHKNIDYSDAHYDPEKSGPVSEN